MNSNPFTDDDLDRLKKWLDLLPTERILLKFAGYEHEFSPIALLARLEKAEAVIHQLVRLTSDPHQDAPVIEAWRKACGK